MAERNEHTERMLNEPGNLFICWKQLDDGTYVALGRLMYTTGLFIGVEPISPYKRRYCFKGLLDAQAEYEATTTGDYEPTGWIARRPETPEMIEAKSGPGYDPTMFWPKRGSDD